MADSYSRKTIQRRNSTIAILDENDEKIVEKRYHARFNVLEEASAYAELERLLEPYAGIRTAKVLKVDAENGCLRLEYISGPSLWDSFGSEGVRAFQGARDLVLASCAEAAKQGLRFDFSPEHLLRDPATGDWVVIDPLCESMELKHFSAIVFLQGMFRCFIKHRRLWRAASFTRIWKSFLRRYRVLAGISCHEFNREMCSYIDRVIEWNRQPNETESRGMRLIRRIGVIPFWRGYRALFRWNWIK